VRLFTALWPSPAAVDALDAELAGAGPDWPPEGWRRVPSHRWHLALSCLGDDADPGFEARRLEAALAGRAAPRLRLSGAGFLPRVGYAQVMAAGPADLAALAELVAAAGGPDGYLPHVAVARARNVRAWPPGDSALHRHRGPWWLPSEVRLVHSSRTPSPPRYRVVHRVPLRCGLVAGPQATDW
jgi:RNA 2',3'-cyclic 3'-phosphodiesterase